jgi:hypothetical protein
MSSTSVATGGGQCAPRNRAVYAAWLLAVIVLGIGSRHGIPVPRILHKSAGDILWATAVFLIIGMVWPRLSTARAAAFAMAFSVTIEFTQIYHAPWIDAVRKTLPGALILGSGFAWADMGSYVVGVAIGVLGEMAHQAFARSRLRRATEDLSYRSSG